MNYCVWKVSVPDIIRRLWAAVRRKRPEKMENQHVVLLHDNAPAHRSVLVKDFLAKNNVTELQHPSCSPDLSASDYYLFSRLTSATKGRHFCDATDIIKNATEELKRLLQND
jgi:hypothetical protein